MRSHRTLATLAVLVALLAPGSAANADFHFMLIEELDTGQTGAPEQEFVDLQMYEAGHNFVGGHKLRVYAADGSAQDCTFPSSASVGVDDSHILIAASNPIHGETADFLLPQPIMDGAGGAVCFAGVDCVSWGSFAGSTSPASGTPIPGDFGALDTSMHRDKGADDTLQRTDDTNDSAADFDPGPPAPEHNPGNTGTPAQMSCEPVVVTPPPDAEEESPSLTKLTTKVKGTRAIVRGRIEPPAPGENVQLIFFANGSPLRKIAKGKAALNDDGLFKKRFKVPADSTRCKAVVRFRGSRVGKKTFRC